MGIGMRELLIILLVVLLVFGAKKLRTIGSDLGAAVRGFKKAVNEGENEEERSAAESPKLRSERPDAEFAESSQSEQKGERRSA